VRVIIAMAAPPGLRAAIPSPGTQAALSHAARRESAAAAQGLGEAAGSAAAAIGAFTAAPLYAWLGAGPAWFLAGVVMASLLTASAVLDRPQWKPGSRRPALATTTA
jgi:hypothetical protein